MPAAQGQTPTRILWSCPTVCPSQSTEEVHLIADVTLLQARCTVEMLVMDERLFLHKWLH
eukprot:1432809-Amphidinium_carterae.1